MKKYTFALLWTALVGFFFSTQLLAGSISGEVNAPKRVKKMIVYLSRETLAKEQRPVQKHVVSQKDTHFSPALWIISVGDSIEWANDETKEIDHNIFSLSSLKRFDLGLGEKGSKLSQSFNKSGILNYYCSVHKEMEGKLVILPSQHYQLLEKSADFKIDNLPEGEWTLNVLVFHRRYKVKPIKLTIGKELIQGINLEVIKR